MDNRPIGIFDSGLGGITAFCALRKLMPNENIIYFGDTGRMPYGTRETAQLRLMAGQDLERMASMGVKAIIAACGTVSSTAADVISGFEVPSIGVINSTVMAASKLCKNALVGLAATDASVKSGVFQRELGKLNPGQEIISVGCPDFVTLIESGYSSKDDQVKKAVEKYLRPIKAAGAKTVILGCTHFGIISDAISAYMDGAELISASDCAAGAMKRLLTEKHMTGGSGEEHFYTSGDISAFERTAAALLGRDGIAAEYLPPQEV